MKTTLIPVLLTLAALTAQAAEDKVLTDRQSPGQLAGATRAFTATNARADVTLESLLGEMTNYAAVARWPQPEFTCKQASSYDRGTVAPDKPGDFKDEKYLPEFHAMMSWNGSHFFAPESVLAKDGRRVMWAWLLDLPVAPTGVQSLPRELSLPADGALRIKPLRELESLRYDATSKTNLTVKSDAPTRLEGIAGGALELKLSIGPGTAKEFGVEVLCNKDGKGGMPVAIDTANKTLQVGDVKVPFELKAGEPAELRVFIAFVNDRQAAPENQGIQLISRGGEAAVKELKCWKMKSVYVGH